MSGANTTPAADTTSSATMLTVLMASRA